MLLDGSFFKKQPLVVIIGPTAIGKTAAAIEITRHFDGEIVGADSRQVYHLMSIGTARPTPDELQAVPHHLIDIVPPDKPLNVTQYQHLAQKTIAEIHDRGNLPLLVGGTGQYVTALIEGWQIPQVAPQPELREELEIHAETHGWQSLLKRLRQHDPVTADRIDGQNIRRVVRALEVCIVTGTPYSELRRKKPPPYTRLELGLTMEDRLQLYQRADQRIEQMLERGLLEEIQMLVQKGYDWNLPAMSSLGYLEMGAYLRGDVSLDEALTQFKRATRQYIRRQYTWFRKHNPDAIWFEGQPESIPAMIETIQKWINQHNV